MNIIKSGFTLISFVLFRSLCVYWFATSVINGIEGPLSYWNAVYLTLEYLPTVEYGDIKVSSRFRLFLIIFDCIGISYLGDIIAEWRLLFETIFDRIVDKMEDVYLYFFSWH